MSDSEFPVLILGSGPRKYRLMRQGDAWQLDAHQLLRGDVEPDPRRLSFGEVREARQRLVGQRGEVDAMNNPGQSERA